SATSTYPTPCPAKTAQKSRRPSIVTRFLSFPISIYRSSSTSISRATSDRNGDIDLSNSLSGEDRAEIEAAFNRYSVLVFPDQHLSIEQHLDFASNFGPLETTIHATRKDATLRVRAEIADVSNLDAGESIWGKESRKRMFENGQSHVAYRQLVSAPAG